SEEKLKISPPHTQAVNNTTKNSLYRKVTCVADRKSHPPCMTGLSKEYFELWRSATGFYLKSSALFKT
ncbi:MAG TPA: hypothetical protein DCZ12_16810, partial [Gammaproteobacteria bacterium]|nr:hypothetical protein [Gammaproteobacteria bacterium]